MDSAHEYLAHRALIERTIQTLSGRYRLSQADAEDFASTVHLRLVERDYFALRAYKGRCALSTYLYAVIRRWLQDWRDAQWGRWRPSVAARRAGPAAVLLETLVARDGVTLDEAIEMMRTNHGVPEGAAELRTLAATLPRRPPRTVVSESALLDRPADAGAADALVEQQETAEATGRLAGVLDAALTRLTHQEQLILRLRFDEGLPMPAIGRMVGVSGRLLYGRVDRLLASLRRDLEAGGVTAGDVADVLAKRGFEVTPPALFERRQT